MELIVISGVTGAGKSTALHALEDMGYYAVDNLPLFALRRFATQCFAQGGKFKRAAVVVNFLCEGHSSKILENYLSIKEELETFAHCKMLTIEASDETLLHRFRSSQRFHPLASRFQGDLFAAIHDERSSLLQLSTAADFRIDTSTMDSFQLQEQIKHLFASQIPDAMTIQVMSFGYKHGLPIVADFVFDVRCLPNPYYVPELKKHTGVEQCVQEYVMNAPESKEYFQKILQMLHLLIPLYIKKGKMQLIIAFGCTGGRHRSVTFAELISKELSGNYPHITTVHRDTQKDG